MPQFDSLITGFLFYFYFYLVYVFVSVSVMNIF